MINTLYLPELREMLAENNEAELREFCTALHPGRTAEFMEGLDPAETWRVLQFAAPALRAEIFSYLEHDKQVAIIESQDRAAVAQFLAEMAADDRVDTLEGINPQVVEELMPLLPVDERREVFRLQAYPDESAGAVMTTEVARLGETLTVQQALAELARQAQELETIYYIYVVDDTNQLRGVVSARQLVTAMGKPNKTIGDLMETDVVSALVDEDQEEVAHKVARYNLLAIPVVDHERHLVGIITHDDVMDVVREEATEDAHRIAAVEPLDETYMRTNLFTLSWKRGMWLVILFCGALLTAIALRQYEARLEQWTWMVWFIPLVISSGGNSGSQSATLIITAMATGDIALRDWWLVMRRELMMGCLLGTFLGAMGFIPALLMAPNFRDAAVLPLTILFTVICGTLTGSLLPMLFRRLGLDPALMSIPFVAGIIDIIGIVIYMNTAIVLLST